MKKKNSESVDTLPDQELYDEVKFCQWCGMQLNKIGRRIPVKCPECGNKCMPEFSERREKDTVDFINKNRRFHEIRGTFSIETARLLREQIECTYDYSNLASAIN